MMRKPLISLIALAALSAPAAAQEATPAQPAQPTKAEVEAATATFSLIASALNSEQVPGPVKSALFGCMYQAPLGEISKALTAATEQADIAADDHNKRLVALAAICGARDPSQTPPAE